MAAPFRGSDFPVRGRDRVGWDSESRDVKV